MTRQHKIAIYIRSATRSQSSAHELNDQEVICRDLIGRNFPELASDIDSIPVFRDLGFSGMNMDRPAIQAVLNGIQKAEINVIVVKDYARLSRSITDLMEFRNVCIDSGTVIQTVHGVVA